MSDRLEQRAGVFVTATPLRRDRRGNVCLRPRLLLKPIEHLELTNPVCEVVCERASAI